MVILVLVLVWIFGPVLLWAALVGGSYALRRRREARRFDGLNRRRVGL